MLYEHLFDTVAGWCWQLGLSSTRAGTTDAGEGEGEARAEHVLARIAHRVQPVALARDQVLPVLPAFEALLPERGLRRGTVTRAHGPGATSLALALLAGCTGAGAWVAAIGVSGLGLSAAGELGVALERVLLVEAGPEQWVSAVGAALDGVDALLIEVPRRVRAADARRLQARLRERGAVVVILGSAGSFQPDLVMAGGTPTWSGLGSGWGRLQARCLSVEVSGRRAASRPRSGLLWLPGPDGKVSLQEPAVGASANVVALHPLKEAG